MVDGGRPNGGDSLPDVFRIEEVDRLPGRPWRVERRRSAGAVPGDDVGVVVGQQVEEMASREARSACDEDRTRHLRRALSGERRTARR